MPAAGRPAASGPGAPGRPASSLAAKAPPPPKRAPDPPPSEEYDEDDAPTGFFVHSSPIAYDPDGPPPGPGVELGLQAEQRAAPLPAAGNPAAQLMDAVADSEPPTAIAQAYQGPEIPKAPAMPSPLGGPAAPVAPPQTMPGLPPMPGPPPRTMAGASPAKRTMMGMPAMQPMAPPPAPAPAGPQGFPLPGAAPIPSVPQAPAMAPQGAGYPGAAPGYPPQQPMQMPGVGPMASSPGMQAPMQMPGVAAAASAPAMQIPMQMQPGTPSGAMPGAPAQDPMLAFQQAMAEHASRGGPPVVTDANSHPSSQVSRPFHTPTSAPMHQPDPGAAPGWLKAFAFASIASAVSVLAVLGWMLSQRL